MSAKMTSINLRFYWKCSWGDVNYLLSIKLCLNRQGDSEVSEGREVCVCDNGGVKARADFLQLERIAICS